MRRAPLSHCSPAPPAPKRPSTGVHCGREVSVEGAGRVCWLAGLRSHFSQPAINLNCRLRRFAQCRRLSAVCLAPLDTQAMASPRLLGLLAILIIACEWQQAREAAGATRGGADLQRGHSPQGPRRAASAATRCALGTRTHQPPPSCVFCPLSRPPPRSPDPSPLRQAPWPPRARLRLQRRARRPPPAPPPRRAAAATAATATSAPAARPGPGASPAFAARRVSRLG